MNWGKLRLFSVTLREGRAEPDLENFTTNGSYEQNQSWTGEISESWYQFVQTVLGTRIPDLLDIHIFCSESCVLSRVIAISNVTNSFPASDWSMLWILASDWLIRVQEPDPGEITRCWLPGCWCWYNVELDFFLINWKPHQSEIIASEINAHHVLGS